MSETGVYSLPYEETIVGSKPNSSIPSRVEFMYCLNAVLSLMTISHSSFAVGHLKPNTLFSEIGLGSSSSKALITFLIAIRVVVFPLPGMPFSSRPHFFSGETSQLATASNCLLCCSFLI